MTTQSGQTRRSAENNTVRDQSQADYDGAQQPIGLLEVPSTITVSDLAVLMDTSAVEVIKEFMRNGFMYTINEVVEHVYAAEVAEAFGFEVMPLEKEKGPGSLVVSTDDEDPDQLETRPPVVTILGHVDHGKTTLLDTIRHTNVVTGEAGGITQHIGAYQIEYQDHLLTFVDTPGHEAFTAMRIRGAQVTDIAILVVAADDGIMPQTVEAIDHVKAAGVPIIVAINKMDRADSNADRVKQQLTQYDLLVEEWGGEVIAVPVSALTGEGVPELLDNILVVAEVSELKANPHKPGRGVVVEARVDKSRGSVATVLVQSGTLRNGDNIVVGNVRGRVRALFNDQGTRIKQANPSQPVEILGLSALPEAGDILEVVADEKTARQMVERRIREQALKKASGPTLQDVHTRIESGEVKSLNLIVKTDVQGTIEAIRGALEKLNTDRIRVNIVHIASGSITDSDILLAVASEAIIIGFNAPAQPGARALANQEGIEVRFYQIIYNLVDDIERAMTGMLDPVYKDIVEGHATVRAVFSVGRRTKVAGFFVNDGKIVRDSTMHILRDNQEIFVGKVVSLKHFKEDVREVAVGFEGGAVFEGFTDFEEGDIIEAHRSELVS